MQQSLRGGRGGGKKNAISPFLKPAETKKKIGATIHIGRKIQCLPYAGFFQLEFGYFQGKGGAELNQNLLGNFFSLGLDIFQEKEEGADPNSNSLSNFCLFENSSEHVSNMSEPTIRGGEGRFSKNPKIRCFFYQGLP